MKARAVFDTLNYANRLKAAGMQDKIAETQAEANADMIANLLDNALLTKQDLSQTELKFESNLREVETRLNTKILDLDTRIHNLETRLTDKIHNVEKQIIQIESHLQQSMKDLETRLTLRLGGIVVGSAALFSALPNIFHFLHKIL